jgi:hypothetical protein
MRTLDPARREQPWRRDLKLLFQMAGMLVAYFVVGGRLRRRYRALEARGETFWLDEDGPREHREAALRR